MSEVQKEILEIVKDMLRDRGINPEKNVLWRLYGYGLIDKLLQEGEIDPELYYAASSALDQCPCPFEKASGFRVNHIDFTKSKK